MKKLVFFLLLGLGLNVHAQTQAVTINSAGAAQNTYPLNAANGIPKLDASAKLLTAQLPAVAATSANNLSFFSATTSAQLAGIVPDETGSGPLVFGTSPSLTRPSLGTATATTINGVTIPAVTDTVGLLNQAQTWGGSTNTFTNNVTIGGTLTLTGGINGTIYTYNSVTSGFPVLGSTTGPKWQIGVETDANGSGNPPDLIVGNGTTNYDLSKPYVNNIQSPPSYTSGPVANVTLNGQSCSVTGGIVNGGEFYIYGGAYSGIASIGIGGPTAFIGGASTIASGNGQANGGQTSVIGGVAVNNGIGQANGGQIHITGGAASGNSSAAVTGGQIYIDGGPASGGSTNINGTLNFGVLLSTSAITIGRTAVGPVFPGGFTSTIAPTLTSSTFKVGSTPVLITVPSTQSDTLVTLGAPTQSIVNPLNIGTGSDSATVPMANFGAGASSSAVDFISAGARSFFGYNGGATIFGGALNAVVQAGSGKGIEFDESNTFGSGTLMWLSPGGRLEIKTTGFTDSGAMLQTSTASFSGSITDGVSANHGLPLYETSGGVITGGAGIGAPGVLATVTGINVKTVANTLLYTVPTGKTLTILSVILRTTATTGAAAGPTVNVFTSTSGDIYASQAIGATSSVGQTFIFPNTGVVPSIPAGGTVNLGVTVGAVSTTEVVQADLIGILE